MRVETQKSIEEKKFAYVAKFFCGHAYLTDLIGRIWRTSEPWKKKSHWLDELAYSRTNEPWRKNDKTVSF